MSTPVDPSRRGFMKATSAAAATSSLVAGALAPRAFADDDNTVQLALVGCGGRGTGAATNALRVDNGPIKLVAMADVFEGNLKNSHGNLAKRFSENGRLEVPEDQKFIGFDGYKKAMDCLRPGDVVILTTPPAFRWVHYTYAIERGLNVFMEKPVATDAPGVRRV